MESNAAYSVFANTKNMSREDWLKTRKMGIGGSDAAAIIGMSAFGSRLSVWADKTSDDVEQETEITSEPIWLGNMLEEPVARRYAQESGLNIIRCNMMMQSVEHPFMLANIDRRVKGKKIGVEIKTTSPYTKVDYENGDIEPRYYVQCMHYLAVTGWDEWKLVVYVIDREMYTFSFKRADHLGEIESLIKAEEDFWNSYVVPRKPPAVDGSDASAEVLTKLFPASNSETIMLDCDDAIAQYVKIGEQIKELEQTRSLYQQKIQEQMGENEKGETANYVVTWKSTAPRKTFDSKRFKEDWPDIYDMYLKIGAPTRRFSVKGA